MVLCTLNFLEDRAHVECYWKKKNKPKTESQKKKKRRKFLEVMGMLTSLVMLVSWVYAHVHQDVYMKCVLFFRYQLYPNKAKK